MAFFNTPLGNLRLLLDRGADGIQRELHLVVIEQLEDSPPAGSGAILELALGAVVALVDAGYGWVLAEVDLGLAVSFEN